LQELKAQYFVGISLYISSNEDIRDIRNVLDEIWGWISNQG